METSDCKSQGGKSGKRHLHTMRRGRLFLPLPGNRRTGNEFRFFVKKIKNHNDTEKKVEYSILTSIGNDFIKRRGEAYGNEDRHGHTRRECPRSEFG